MNALVTGASGFLGRYVVEQLTARGDRVRALCRSDGRVLGGADILVCPTVQQKGQSAVEIVRVDLRDRQAVIDACRGVDAVFHVGGVTGMGGPWKRYYEANVLGTRHVVEGCIAHGIRRLVYTSSPSVTFDGTSQEGVDESAPYGGPLADGVARASSPWPGDTGRMSVLRKRWLCHYAHSKALAEQLVLAANGQGGLLCCALRPHLIWGPRDRQLIPRLLADARRGRLRRVGDGTNLIDTVYVENAAAAHLLAADALRPGSPVPGGAYFISQGEPVNCWQWIDSLLALGGLPPVRKSMSYRAAWALGAAYETAYALLRLRGEPPMTRFLAAQMSQSHYFNIARARRDFGYEPKISMAEGMRRLAAAIRV